jgi:hypothetical protein
MLMATASKVSSGVLAVVVVGVWMSHADAAVVICKHKKKLVLRESACKASEQPLNLAGTSIDVAGLPKVPAASQADSAGTAANAANADNAENADNADVAETAEFLGDFASDEFSPVVRWAYVTSAGEIAARSDSEIEVVAETVTGIVILDFGDDLTGRGLAATLSGGAASRGMIQASICGAPSGGPQTTNCNIEGAENVTSEIAIATLDTTGALADRPFHVAVIPTAYDPGAGLGGTALRGFDGPSPLLMRDDAPAE